MTGHRITHIRKNGPPSDCKCITNVKLGKEGSLTIEEVIKMMRGKSGDRMAHQFYIMVEGMRVEVKAVPSDAPSYLRTERNDSPYDNLLSLPTF